MLLIPPEQRLRSLMVGSVEEARECP
jgi:hypothetical protein